jgi:Ni/Co efflux regulator RcnB
MAVFVRLLVLLIALVASGSALAQRAENAHLRQFAQSAGLRDIDGFIETVTSLRKDATLPARYFSKREAEKHGWRPGDDLCRTARGKSIGGDYFANREGRLPRANGRNWHEADLDFNCGRRGAKRLVWSNDGMIYVTVDHYATFREVPK